VFVARFNMNLTQLQACLVVGGSAEDTPRGSLLVVPGATATDTRVYVSGRTASSNFPVAGLSPSMTPYQSSPGGGHDAFLFKLDSLLLPVWGTYLGGSGDDFANANVRVDGDHVFIAGCAKSPRSSFSPALPSGGAQSDLAGTMGLEDGFVARFSASAGTLDAFTYLGGEDRDYVSSNDVLELTTTGKPVVAGITRSRCLPVVNAVFPLHSGCASGTPCANCPAPPSTDAGNDAFVGRLSADLGTLEFLSYVGGTDREEPAGLAVDRIGNVYLTGETASSDFPITLARAFDTSFTPSAPAAWNMAFLVKLSTSPPSSLDYSSFFGGDVNAGGTTQLGTRGRSLMLLPSGDALLSGVTTTSDLPATSGVVFVSYQTGVTDGFVTVHFVN
jgi:hypothetical protein